MNNLKNEAKQVMLGGLHCLGFNIVRASPQVDVEFALNLLRPYETEFPLKRFGSYNDGGYLLPLDIDGISHIFSPGVADDWSFEDHLSAETGATVEMIECGEVPDGISHHVTNGFLGGFSDENQVGVNDWIGQAGAGDAGEWILSMDIEGAEFEVLLGLSEENLRRFRIITVEFHQLGRLADANWLRDVYLPTLRKIRKYFIPVHVHGNNHVPTVRLGRFVIPQLMEVTFLRRDRVASALRFSTLPHAFDQRCDMRKPEVSLPILWK